jgi:hypothetical protein
MQGAENVWRYNTDTQELITIQPLAVKAIQNYVSTGMLNGNK